MRKTFIYSSILSALMVSTSYADSHAMQKEIQQLKLDLAKTKKRLDHVEKSNAAQGSKKGVNIESSNPGVTLKIGGFLNRMVSVANNGKKTRVLHLDNSTEVSRFWLKGSGKINDDLTVGTTVEMQLNANRSYAHDIVKDNNTKNTISERKLEIYLKHKKFGSLYMGQGNMASNGVSEQDLSGTYITSGSLVQDIAGGLKFRDSDNKAGPAVATVFNNYDGLGRKRRIRYDTPSFSGFSLSASHEASKTYDVALRYNTDIKDVMKAAAAVSYAKKSGKDPYKLYSSSLSLLFKNGLSLTGSLAQKKYKDNTKKKGTNVFAKLGYQFDMTDCGKSYVSVDYTNGSNIDAANLGKSRAYGLFYIQDIDKVGLRLYAGGRLYKHLKKDDEKKYKNISVGIVGAKLTF